MSYFHGYGGWRLHETETVEQAAAAAATHMLSTFQTRARVVEVEIYNPVNESYQYLCGYTFDDRIPPHRKDHRDVDCRVNVIHHLDIRQGD
jgi:hypothetical protein